MRFKAIFCKQRLLKGDCEDNDISVKRVANSISSKKGGGITKHEKERKHRGSKSHLCGKPRNRTSTSKRRRHFCPICGQAKSAMERHFEHAHTKLPEWRVVQLLSSKLEVEETEEMRIRRKMQHTTKKRRTEVQYKCPMDGCEWQGARPKTYHLKIKHKLSETECNKAMENAEMIKPTKTSTTEHKMIWAGELANQFVQWLKSTTGPMIISDQHTEIRQNEIECQVAKYGNRLKNFLSYSDLKGFFAVEKLVCLEEIMETNGPLLKMKHNCNHSYGKMKKYCAMLDHFLNFLGSMKLLGNWCSKARFQQLKALQQEVFKKITKEYIERNFRGADLSEIALHKDLVQKFFDSQYLCDILQELHAENPVFESSDDYTRKRNVMILLITLLNGNRSATLSYMLVEAMREAKENEGFLTIKVTESTILGSMEIPYIRLPAFVFEALAILVQFTTRLVMEVRHQYVFCNSNGTYLTSTEINGAVEQAWRDFGKHEGIIKLPKNNANMIRKTIISLNQEPMDAEGRNSYNLSQHKSYNLPTIKQSYNIGGHSPVSAIAAHLMQSLYLATPEYESSDESEDEEIVEEKYDEYELPTMKIKGHAFGNKANFEEEDIKIIFEGLNKYIHEKVTHPKEPIKGKEILNELHQLGPKYSALIKKYMKGKDGRKRKVHLIDTRVRQRIRVLREKITKAW